ncbi:MAG TPA: hypothetical protein VJ184_06270 [Chryseolinea sp.]|nr:hypothetical protein [Chryseolinea sp.]
MVQHKKAISILELKRLLYDLRDKQSYTCIRFRFLGGMWQKDFLQIFKIDEMGAVFHNEFSGELLKLSKLYNIIQFELDHNFQQYQAHFHYNVVLDDVTE